jgi:small metal-binding protein
MPMSSLLRVRPRWPTSQAGKNAKANPHTDEAIKHFEQAIDEGNEGHADQATTHAEAALNHLQQVN